MLDSALLPGGSSKESCVRTAINASIQHCGMPHSPGVLCISTGYDDRSKEDMQVYHFEVKRGPWNGVSTLSEV